jgi:hypothetical protein
VTDGLVLTFHWHQTLPLTETKIGVRLRKATVQAFTLRINHRSILPQSVTLFFIASRVLNHALVQFLFSNLFPLFFIPIPHTFSGTRPFLPINVLPSFSPCSFPWHFSPGSQKNFNFHRLSYKFQALQRRYHPPAAGWPGDLPRNRRTIGSACSRIEELPCATQDSPQSWIYYTGDCVVDCVVVEHFVAAGEKDSSVIKAHFVSLRGHRSRPLPRDRR